MNEEAFEKARIAYWNCTGCGPNPTPNDRLRAALKVAYEIWEREYVKTQEI